MDWRKMLAHVTGTVDEELLLRNEYLLAENRILRSQLKGAVRLDDTDRRTLADLGRRLGRKALEEVASIVRPATILEWHRRLVEGKRAEESARRRRGRPPIPDDVEQLILRLARQNRSWGHDRIVGALANLGIKVGDRTVGNVLRRHGVPPAPARKRETTWKEFISSHRAVLAAADFFTAEVWTLGGLVTCLGVTVIVDSRERYGWMFPDCDVTRRALAVGDYALEIGGTTVAVVERKTEDNFVAEFGRMPVFHQVLGQLEKAPGHALVVEADYARIIDPKRWPQYTPAFRVKAVAEIFALHPALRVVFASSRKLANEWTRATSRRGRRTPRRPRCRCSRPAVPPRGLVPI